MAKPGAPSTVRWSPKPLQARGAWGEVGAAAAGGKQPCLKKHRPAPPPRPATVREWVCGPLALAGPATEGGEFHRLTSDSPRRSSDKIGTIQRRLAWPLRKDGTHKSRRVDYVLFRHQGPAARGELRQSASAPRNHGVLRKPPDLTLGQRRL